MSTCVCVCDTMTFTDLVMLGFNFLSVVNGCVCTYLYTGICDTMTFSWPCLRFWFQCLEIVNGWRRVRMCMCMRVWNHDLQLTLWRWNLNVCVSGGVYVGICACVYDTMTFSWPCDVGISSFGYCEKLSVYACTSVSPHDLQLSVWRWDFHFWVSWMADILNVCMC